jgi:hypothetical protein
MPGRPLLSTVTSSNLRAIQEHNNSMAGAAAPDLTKLSLNIYGTGCGPVGVCKAAPGAWVPPWGVETGGVNWDMPFSEAIANRNTTDFITEVDDGAVYDADTGNSAGFTVYQYSVDPNSYELPENARVRGGNPLNGSSCKDINASYNTFSFRYPGVVISIIPPITFTFTPIGGSEVTMSGCPDSYYTLEGHLQNSPTSGIIDINGTSVQCTWETVT